MSIITSQSTVIELVTEYGNRIWTSDDYRKRSMANAQRFADYSNYGQLPLTEFSPLHIINYQNHLSKSVSGSTVNRHSVTLSSIFKFAHEMRLIEMPMPIKWMPEGKPRTFVFDDETIVAMIAYLRKRGDDWMADMICVGTNTGKRL